MQKNTSLKYVAVAWSSCPIFTPSSCFYFVLITIPQLLSEVLITSPAIRQVEVTVRLTVSQSVCQGIEPTLGLVTRHYFLSEGCFCLKVAVLSLWGALSDERSGLSFSVSSKLSVFTSSTYVSCVLQFSNLYTINIKLQSVPSEYSRLCSTSYIVF
jgi:hypothetical protein